MFKMFDHLLAAIREFERYEAKRRAVVRAAYAPRPCAAVDYEKPAYLRRPIQVRTSRVGRPERLHRPAGSSSDGAQDFNRG